MFQFANNQVLYLLFLVPLLIGVYILFYYWRVRDINRFANHRLMKVLASDLSRTREQVRLSVFMVALISLIFAAAGPRFGSKLAEKKMKGYEIVVALDVSNSMLAEDIRPNRLEQSKRAIKRLLGRFDDDKIALVIFAGDAYVQLPMTPDLTTAGLYLEAISTELLTNQGTSIVSAMQLSEKLFTQSESQNKVLILISDGEDHEPQAVEWARQLVEKSHVTLYTIGVGEPEGVLIPIYDVRGNKSFMKDQSGNNVKTKLNEALLQEIASVGSGLYVKASNSNLGLNTIMDDIQTLKEEEVKGNLFSEFDEQYQYFALPALLLLLLSFIILEKKNNRLGF